MQIARESTLFGYQKQSRLVSPYVSREIERKTRQGALEECIPLDLIDCPPIKPMEVPLKSTKQTEPEKIEILDEDLSCFTAPEVTCFFLAFEYPLDYGFFYSLINALVN